MARSESIVWLMLSVLQAFLAFTGILPPEMIILETILGGNSIAFFIIFLYFMFRRKPKALLDSDYRKNERTMWMRDEAGTLIEVDQSSKGSGWEKWTSILWFVTLVVGTLSIL